MKFRIYNTFDSGENFELGDYPTIEEARTAVLEDMKGEEEFLKEAGMTEIVLDKKNYTIQFKNARGHIKHWLWGAEPVRD